MNSYGTPQPTPAGEAKPWSFGMFALGFFAWMFVANGIVGLTSMVLVYSLTNHGNPTAATLPLLVAIPTLEFVGVFAFAILLAKKSGNRGLRDGFIAAAILSLAVTLLLIALFSSAIYVLGRHS